MARPSLLTDELRDQFVGMVRAGNVVQVACEAVGVDVRTYQRWMARDDDPYKTFREQVQKAQAEAEARAVTQIAAAAREDWRAAAWWLERQYPDRWARPQVRAAEDTVAPPVTTDGVDDLAAKRSSRREAAQA